MRAFKKILLAPSAYKGTFSAAGVASALASGVKSVIADAEIEFAPIGDGGDGTLAALASAVNGEMHSVIAMGALSDPVKAEWLEFKNTAIVELACASGLGMLTGRVLEPLRAHTFGTGQVMAACHAAGLEDIIVCVGGSASTDGGAGLLQALGVRLFDEHGQDICLGGGALSSIFSCDLSSLKTWRHAQISVATDVTSPLLGLLGAAHVFGPQKGADAPTVELLESALNRFADVLEGATGRKKRDLPGAGAAGGTAFGLACALDARIVPGFEWLSQTIALKEKIDRCDLVVTGEGCLDSQSLTGKATGELARLCTDAGKPLWVVSAVVQKDLDWCVYGVEHAIEASQNGRPATTDSIASVLAQVLRRKMVEQ